VVVLSILLEEPFEQRLEEVVWERRSLVVLLFDDHYKYVPQVNVIIAFRVIDPLSLAVCDLIWMMTMSMSTFHGFRVMEMFRSC